MIIKIFVTFFIVFALSRVYLRHRDGSMTTFALILWFILWCGVGFFAWMPKTSDIIAHEVGIGRGVDALVYISIVALFYGVFRIYIKLEFIEREITSLVRNLAVKKNDVSNKSDNRHLH
jgi:small membrane protein